jgi:hypothetical protein
MRAAGWPDLYTRPPNRKGSCRESHHGPPSAPSAKSPTPKRVRLGSPRVFHRVCCPHAVCPQECPHTKDPPRATRVPPRAFYYTPGAACVLRIVCAVMSHLLARTSWGSECILIIDIFWVFMVVCCCRTPDIVVLQYRCALV